MAVLLSAGMGFALGCFWPQRGVALRIMVVMSLLGTLVGFVGATAQFGLHDSVGILLLPAVAAVYYGLGSVARRQRDRA